MTPREEVRTTVLACYENMSAAIASFSAMKLAASVNDAFSKTGTEGNNDFGTLVQAAAMVMVMAEMANLNGGSLPL